MAHFYWLHQLRGIQHPLRTPWEPAHMQMRERDRGKDNETEKEGDGKTETQSERKVRKMYLKLSFLSSLCSYTMFKCHSLLYSLSFMCMFFIGFSEI